MRLSKEDFQLMPSSYQQIAEEKETEIAKGRVFKPPITPFSHKHISLPPCVECFLAFETNYHNEYFFPQKLKIFEPQILTQQMWFSMWIIYLCHYRTNILLVIAYLVLVILPLLFVLIGLFVFKRWTHFLSTYHDIF